MASFKDITGREYQLKFTIGTIRRLKESNIDFLKYINDIQEEKNTIEMIYLISSFLYKVVEPQVKKLNLTEEEFYDSFDINSLSDIQVALNEAFVDFFPKSQEDKME